MALKAFAKAIRLSASELQDVSLVGEAVKKCGGEALIAKDLGPVHKAQIGSDEQSDVLIEGGTELKDQMGAGGGEGNEAKFIENDDLLFECGIQELGEAVFILRLKQVIDEGQRIWDRARQPHLVTGGCVRTRACESPGWYSPIV